MHVQCAADADNILEKNLLGNKLQKFLNKILGRSESISSIDETPNVKTEPEASESMEVETNITTVKVKKRYFQLFGSFFDFFPRKTICTAT